jgi:hypothetical protein
MTRRDAEIVSKNEYRGLSDGEKLDIEQRIEDDTCAVDPEECHRYFTAELRRLMQEESSGKMNEKDFEYTMLLLSKASRRGYSPSRLPGDFSKFTTRYGWSF